MATYRSAHPAGIVDPDRLKIMIVATPKTGNEWLKNILSKIYDLPMPVLPQSASNVEEFNHKGDRWVGHEHYFPEEGLLDMSADRGFIPVTMLRHPADVFLSLFHFTVNRQNADPPPPAQREMLRDGGELGSGAYEYLRDSFYRELLISAAWRRHTTRLVRYEDLISKPVEVVRDLTVSLLPVTLDRIRSGVAQSELSLLRATRFPAEYSYHFRKGKAGGWREELPEELVEVFRSREPYPTILKALGYSMDDEPAVEPFDYSEINPFHGKTHFSNGVRVSPCIVLTYLGMVGKAVYRWPDPTVAEGEHSFINWLNKAANEDPSPHDNPLLITNMALAIYNTRPDVREAFPDCFGRDRTGFCAWFIERAGLEYALDMHFLLPTIASMAAA